MEVANLYRISFLTDVIPEDGDSTEGIAGFVADLGSEWLPDGFVFNVEAELPPGSGRFVTIQEGVTA